MGSWRSGLLARKQSTLIFFISDGNILRWSIVSIFALVMIHGVLFACYGKCWFISCNIYVSFFVIIHLSPFLIFLISVMLLLFVSSFLSSSHIITFPPLFLIFISSSTSLIIFSSKKGPGQKGADRGKYSRCMFFC